jgi:predicted heme/steroid binding protein
MRYWGLSTLHRRPPPTLLALHLLFADALLPEVSNNLLLIFSGGVVLEGSERKFTLEELKQYDGRNGKPAYIAYKGKVYDVTDDFLWVDGDHQGEHAAGQDLTAAMSRAPHGEETLERVKQIGILVS